MPLYLMVAIMAFGYLALGLLSVWLMYYVWGVFVGRVFFWAFALSPLYLPVLVPYAIMVWFNLYERDVHVRIERDWGWVGEGQPAWYTVINKTRLSGPAAFAAYLDDLPEAEARMIRPPVGRASAGSPVG